MKPKILYSIPFPLKQMHAYTLLSFLFIAKWHMLGRTKNGRSPEWPRICFVRNTSGVMVSEHMSQIKYHFDVYAICTWFSVRMARRRTEHCPFELHRMDDMWDDHYAHLCAGIHIWNACYFTLAVRFFSVSIIVFLFFLFTFCCRFFGSSGELVLIYLFLDVCNLHWTNNSSSPFKTGTVSCRTVEQMR